MEHDGILIFNLMQFNITHLPSRCVCVCANMCVFVCIDEQDSIQSWMRNIPPSFLPALWLTFVISALPGPSLFPGLFCICLFLLLLFLLSSSFFRTAREPGKLGPVICSFVWLLLFIKLSSAAADTHVYLFPTEVLFHLFSICSSTLGPACSHVIYAALKALKSFQKSKVHLTLSKMFMSSLIAFSASAQQTWLMQLCCSLPWCASKVWTWPVYSLKRCTFCTIGIRSAYILGVSKKKKKYS